MNVIEQEIEDVKRFKEIISILGREGCGYVLDRLQMRRYLPLHRRAEASTADVPPPERLRETFEELGPTFIKFGQILAQRPDIVPPEYIEELEKLEDAVPPFDTATAKDIVEEEIGPIDETFDEFEDEPLAAASIAQVHRATLDTGDEVVVKIRRPGIEDTIREDLDILLFMAKQGEKHVDRLAAMRAYSAVKEFADWTQDELNLRQEGRNAQILQQNLADEDRVTVPDVYMDLTTERVLVMEYVEGVKSDDTEGLQELEVAAEEVARTAIRAGLKQTIRDGFFHADPHPSNFLIDEEGNIIYLDFGMMGKLTVDMRRNLGLLLLHAANEEVDAAVDVVREMATVEDDADLDGLKQDIEESILTVRNTTLEDQSITKALFDIAVKASDRGVHMPPSTVILAKSMLTMEGIGLTIYPEFEMKEEFERMAEKLLYELNSPSKLFRSFLIDAVQNRELVARFPTQLNRMIGGTSGEQQEQRIEVEAGPGRDAVVAGALILGSFALLVQALPVDYMLPVGIFGLLAAAWTLVR
ncbi:MAG: AarF/ABC1/UbiB kinase family protein [Candidatus Nanohaloarchaea archaeon]|nr:AarF/ABC1/UbiB kinase family protein [Candidatus Nanohaloarchaea archaeon]